MASAPTLPTPASRTIMSISPERASSSKSKRSARTGNRVVSEMKSRPWTPKAAAMASRGVRSEPVATGIPEGGVDGTGSSCPSG